MGSDRHYPEELPAHPVIVDGFWIDTRTVTNAEFAAFVAATGYVTLAERPLDLDLYPGAIPELAVPGALVFHMTDGPVDTRDLRHWWHYVPGACWKYPEALEPASRGVMLTGVHVAFEDALAHAGLGGQDCAERGGTGVRRARRAGRRLISAGVTQNSLPAGGHWANTCAGAVPMGAISPWMACRDRARGV